MPPAPLYLVESMLDLVPPEPSLDALAESDSAPSQRWTEPKTAGYATTESFERRNRYIGRPDDVRTGSFDVLRRTEAVQGSATHVLGKRSGLSVSTDSQKVTLGVIAAYAVVISILWVTPVLKWVLWPFKVRAVSHNRPAPN